MLIFTKKCENKRNTIKQLINNGKNSIHQFMNNKRYNRIFVIKEIFD